MKNQTFFAEFILFNIAKIIPILIFLFIGIPKYYHHFDQGNQAMDLDSLSAGQQKFSSHNVTFQARPLVEKAIIEMETRDGKLSYTRFIIPVVSLSKTEEDPICCFIQREFSESEGTGNELLAMQSFLSMASDSIYTFSGTAMNYLHEVWMEGLSFESMSNFKNEQGLSIADSPLLVQIDYRPSKEGLIFGTIVMLALLMWIFISFVNLWKKNKAMRAAEMTQHRSPTANNN